MARSVNDPNNGEPNYNEEEKAAPEHRMPAGISVSLDDHPGAAARLLIERFFQRTAMFEADAVEDLDVEMSDVVRYRKQIQDAFLAVVREGPAGNDPRLRAGVVAHLGELGFEEGRSVLSGLATSAVEQPAIRATALDALTLLSERDEGDVVRSALSDPDPLVRARALDIVARSVSEEDIAVVRPLMKDLDPEVRRRAALVLRAAGERVPDDLVDPHRPAPGDLIEDEDIHRAVGREHGLPNLGSHAPEGKEDQPEGGGRDASGEALANALMPAPLRSVASYEVLRSPTSETVRLRLVGAAVPAAGPPGSQVFRSSDHEAVMDIPGALMPPAGYPLPGCGCDDPAEAPTWVREGPPSPAIHAIEPDQPTVLAGTPFGIRVRFHVPDDQHVELLRVETRFPLDSWTEATFAVDPEDSARGETVVPGYVAGSPGGMDVRVSLYGSRGGAAHAEARFVALPSNPHYLLVAPQTTGTNGKGPAHWNASEQRYYCYARFEVVNGHSHAITVGPSVTCRVTDGGSEKANFSFTIGTTTVPAYGSRVLSIYTYYPKGNSVAKVFDNFGDVRQTFTLQTSVGNLTDWHVWQAMAQVKLSLIFVGNMTVSQRGAFQSVAETEASAVYEQRGMNIADTKRYLLPSSHPDWNRFRDIAVKSSKGGNCSSISSSEADDMKKGWSSAPADRLDVFIVETFSGPSCAASLYGFAPVNGPTSKGGKNSGVVLKFSAYNLTTSGGRAGMGVAIAHEVGHFLGLKHTDASQNFMNASTTGSSTNITWDQYTTMRKHGFVRRHVP
ncbi:MAG: HEAT repeat domain-containing protein [Chloroflexi bacterium]|nr:HEAT repeat domain-containing protein [Chloroflexota bacterium]